MTTAYIVVAVTFIAFFPVSATAFLLFDEVSKRLAFCVNVSVFRVFGGYGRQRGKNYVIHTSAKKAKTMTKKDLKAGNLKILKAFSLNSVRIRIKVSPQEAVYTPFVFAVKNLSYPFLSTVYPLLDKSLMVKYGRNFSVAVKVKTYFSIASLVIAFSEVLWKKIKNL